MLPESLLAKKASLRRAFENGYPTQKLAELALVLVRLDEVA
jgi:hypothetical protein